MSGARTSCRRCGQQTADGRKNGQVLKQVWFAGVHSNVGGGYKEHGASDIPLAWMASEVAPFLGIDFGYLKLRRDVSEKWSLGQLHESFKGFFAKLPRAAQGASEGRSGDLI